MREVLIYGCRIEDPSFLEEILFKCEIHKFRKEVLSKCEKWAKENYYDRLRLSVVDLSSKPDFVGTINV